jgi:hypothetical protein
VLAGCHTTPAWTKTGADAAETAEEYQDCRDLAEAAVKTDVDIDQDISASRRTDLQRSGVVRTGNQSMQDTTHERAGSIVDSCMKAKGFRQPP